MSLKWGIVSSGQVSQDFCTALQTLGANNHKIVAVGARSLDDAKQFAERYSVLNYYESYDKVYENDEVNIVYIGNVNHKHKEECIKAIQHGKHILCEKPMTLNAAEQEEVLRLAKENNVFFMEGLWTRFFPAIDRLREEIRLNSIGEIRFVQANLFLNIKDRERLHSKELGGGGILDIGIYAIQMACLIFDHEVPSEIVASGHLMSSGVDECVNIALKYSNKRMAALSISTNAGPHGSVTIAGDKGVLQLPSRFWAPTELVLANGEKLLFPIENSGNIKTNFSSSFGFRYEAEAVRKAINAGLKEHPYVTHDNSRLIMKIMDEARRQIGYV